MKEEIYSLVQEIPKGRVTSYGLVAQQLDIRYDIKTSGWIVWRMLSTMSEGEWKAGLGCPWQRVINRQWYISTMKLGTKWLIQKQLLEREGIEIINDTVDMKKYGWNRK
jgi:methylated-DNA-protein-cysteine methyltransferase related protein